MTKRSAIAAIYAFTALSASAAFATPTLTTLVNFNGVNGAGSAESMILEGSGSLYGTTIGGGTSGDGSVFKIAAGTHALSTLVSFNSSTGTSAYSGVIADAAGNLYGTTDYGLACVYKIAAGTNAFTRLASFNGSNGAAPQTNLLADAAGNLYGTTTAGGSSNDGTVFKVAVGTNILSTLVTFTGANGVGPFEAGLIADASGNLYGTTGGDGSTTGGTAFKIAAGTNTLTTLATFPVINGVGPDSALIADASGNLYGTTAGADGGGPTTSGTLFEIAAGTNKLTTLVTFTGANGANPGGGLIADAAGNLYGTTLNGGPPGSGGTVFELAVGTGQLTTLYAFTGSPFAPEGGLVADASGNLYGTTDNGGSSNDGTVFELTGTGFVVPEPGSLTLIAVGCLALLRRGSRRMVRV